MLCANCRRSFLSRIRSHATTTIRNQTSITATIRRASTVASTPNAIPVQSPPSIALGDQNAATPSSASSPPLTSTSNTGSTGGTKDTPTPSKVKSSVAAGQELRGVAYLKAKPQVLAKEDDEYPPWLWTLLDEPKTATGEAKVNLSDLTKKQRARYERKQEKLLKSVPTSIPLHEQSVDLTTPTDDALTSLQRRQAVTKTSRVARRKSIRESNFLRSM